MAECWARCLGGCKGKISGEHIITESAWKTDRIFVKGLKWCSPSYKEISVRNFTSNMLCERHNSELSNIGVDGGGALAAEAFRKAEKIHNQRSANIEAGFRTGRFDLCEYNLNGLLQERWFLKTLINMELAGDQRLIIGPYLGHGERPHCYLVEMVYGLRPFPDKSGLYIVLDSAHEARLEERISYHSYLRKAENGRYVAAGEFNFHGFHFILALEPNGLPVSAERRSADNEVVRTLSWLHHPELLDFRINDLPSQAIKLGW